MTFGVCDEHYDHYRRCEPHLNRNSQHQALEEPILGGKLPHGTLDALQDLSWPGCLARAMTMYINSEKQLPERQRSVGIPQPNLSRPVDLGGHVRHVDVTAIPHALTWHSGS